MSTEFDEMAKGIARSITRRGALVHLGEHQRPSLAFSGRKAALAIQHGLPARCLGVAWLLALLLVPRGVFAQVSLFKDHDRDGVLDHIDNCPFTFNPKQEDVDGDGVGDSCDNCPHTKNADQADCNKNGKGDLCDPVLCALTFEPKEGEIKECDYDRKLCVVVGNLRLPDPCPPWWTWVDGCCPSIASGCPIPDFSLVLNHTNVILHQAADAYGFEAGDGFGLSIAMLPDLDGDGMPELAIGVPLASPNGLPTAGTVLFISGGDGHEIRRVNGPTTGGAFGVSILRYGTQGGVLIGAPGTNANALGAVWLVNALVGEPTIFASSTIAGDGFGSRLAYAGTNYAIGAPGLLLNPPRIGRVHLLSATGNTLYKLKSPDVNDGFGTAIHDIGDIDGVGGLLVGAPLANPGDRPEAGSAFLFSGTSLVGRWDGESPGDHLGMSVGGGGDIDGDGRADFILGAPGVDSAVAPDVGRAYVYSSRGDLLARYDGSATNGHFGHAVFLEHDENSDGVVDAVICASQQLFNDKLGANFTFPTARPRRPILEITSPAPGSIFFAPEAIVFSARLIDPDGVAGGVEFWTGTNSLGVQSVSPYSLMVTNPLPPPPSYTPEDSSNLYTAMLTVTSIPQQSNGSNAIHIPARPVSSFHRYYPQATASIPGLYNTGVSDTGIPQADDSLDVHYLLVGTSDIVGTPFVARASGGFPIPPWLGDNPDSAWIAPTASTIGGHAAAGQANFIYETRFDLTGFDPASAAIVGRWATDNEGLDILLNGVSTGNVNRDQFSAWTDFEVDHGFVSGVNTLTFVINNGPGEPNTASPTGLRVEMHSAALPCSLIVDNTADSGPGSLRAAIECANNSPGLDTITFAIPGNGPFAIVLLSPLPDIMDPVVIDGYTQSGATPNSLVAGDDAQLQIQIDGSIVVSGGLVIRGGSSTVRGLAINGVLAGPAILLASASNRVEGCFLGTDISGIGSIPNYYGISIQSAGFNIIGGTGLASRNLISGNQKAGIDIEGVGAVQTIVQGNYIGTDVSGDKGLGNGGPGILIALGAHNTHVGGMNPIAAYDLAAGNVIAFNAGSGVTVLDDQIGNQRTDGNGILGNSIFSNGHLGIDLTETFDGLKGDGPTVNDYCDADVGANKLQNCPILEFFCRFATDLKSRFWLHSNPSQVYRIEFFANSSVSSRGLAQGEKFVMATFVTNNVCDVTNLLSLALPSECHYYSATATDMSGNTSEFSPGTPCQTCVPPPCPDCPPPTNALTLQLSSGTGGSEVISYWSGRGYVLQTADSISGPWNSLTVGTMVGTNTQPLFEAHIAVTGVQQFFRLLNAPPCSGFPDALTTRR